MQLYFLKRKRVEISFFSVLHYVFIHKIHFQPAANNRRLFILSPDSSKIFNLQQEMVLTGQNNSFGGKLLELKFKYSHILKRTDDFWSCWLLIK